MKLHYSFGLLAVLVMGCQTTALKGAAAPEAGPQTAKAERHDVVGYAFFDGKVVTPPGAIGKAYSPYDLPIIEVLTSIGKHVNKGQAIIKLNMPDLQAALTQAKLNVSSAQSAYNTAKAELDGPVREAERALSEARAAERTARIDLQNGGGADLESATSARKLAEDNLRAAVAERNAKLQPEKDSIASAVAYLREVQSGAKQSLIKAPITGMVTALDAKPGEVAKTKKELATVVNLAILKVNGTMKPDQSEYAKKGVKVVISIDSTTNESVDGVISDISVVPPSPGEKNGGYLAVIDFDNREGKILPETKIKRLGTPTGKVSDVITVPLNAVTKDSSGHNQVMVQNGSEWVARQVEIGLTDGSIVEIKSGLTEGDVVKLN